MDTVYGRHIYSDIFRPGTQRNTENPPVMTSKSAEFRRFRTSSVFLFIRIIVTVLSSIANAKKFTSVKVFGTFVGRNGPCRRSSGDNSMGCLYFLFTYLVAAQTRNEVDDFETRRILVAQRSGH